MLNSSHNIKLAPLSFVGKCLVSPVTWGLALALAGASAVAFGIVGVGRGGGLGQFDMKYFYIAGRCLRQGMNPYDPANFALCSRGFTNLVGGYFYPPQFGPLAILLSWLPFSGARALICGINLGAVGLLSIFCAGARNSGTNLSISDPAPEARWLIPAIVLGNPFTAHVLWMGQTTLIATAALAGAWVYAWRPSRIWLAGTLMAVATIKPQIALLPILWLLFERRWKVLAVGAAASLLLSLPELLAIGPIETFTGWLSAIARFREVGSNYIGAPHVFGVQNFLAAMGLKVPSLLVVSICATTALWWFRQRVVHWDILALLTTFSLLFGYSHDYDLVALVLLLPAFWRLLRGNGASVLVAILLMLLLCVPQRAVGMHPSLSPVSPADLGNSALVHFRVLVVLALMIWLLVLSIQQSPVASDLPPFRRRQR